MRKKFLIFLILFLFLWISAYSKDYWDFPKYLVKNSKNSYNSNPKVVLSDGKYFIFYIEKVESAGLDYSIKYFTSSDLMNFDGPISTGIDIRAVSGFIPQYDVVTYNNKIYLIWDNIDGSLKFSIKSSDTDWSKPKVIEIGRAFSFAPNIFILNGQIFITYHTESMGRRIDFFIIKSDQSLDRFGPSKRIADEFAGSFFPFMAYSRGKYYCFWQSRPFAEKKTPVFDIYLSISNDGDSWSSPINLTGDLSGEKKFPQAIIKDGNIELFYSSDKDGTWGIYRRFYNIKGIPNGKDEKLNGSMANINNYMFFTRDDTLYVFYLDERAGVYKIYYRVFNSGENYEYQLKTSDNPIFKYTVTADNGALDVFYQNKVGIAWIGPDKTALPPMVLGPKRRIIGKKGIEIKWRRPEDSSGLLGYCYLFTEDKMAEPEIVNLPPEINRLRLIGDKDGEYYFKIRSKDVAGNLSTVVDVKFEVDVTSPQPPKLTPLGLDENGYFKDNRVDFRWKSVSKDVVGYNYSITKYPSKLTKTRIRTSSNRIVLYNLKGGVWYFNIASIDRAGNISETVHYKFKLKLLPSTKVIKEEKKGEKAVWAPWIISKETFRYSPIISILLYLVLGLLFTFVMISSWLLFREISKRRIGKMEEVSAFMQVRKKRLGLRFKFSLLIVSLILVITIGISTVLSYVTINKEKKHLATQMIDKAKITLENITNVAREGILSNDELLLVSVIAKTMENKDIKYTIILDNNNRVIAHSDIKQKGRLLNDEVTLKASKADHIVIEPAFNPDNLAKLYDFASPVFFANKRIGTVRLGYSTESIFKALEESRKDSIYSTIIVTIITIIIGIISAVLMATLTIKPIKILAKGAYIIGSGNLNYKIHVKAKDEIGILADEFNRMTERLAQYQKEMEKKAKLDEQIEIARSIQQNLIPSGGIDNDFVSIGGFYKAATGVGGDYYDFIMKNEKYGLIISDVAGKGVPASLMMTMIRTVFRSLINSGVIYPPRIVTLINNTLISDISSDRFATLLFGIYDHKKMLFQYTNAGYGPIMLFKKSENECSLVEPKKSSIPIGVMPDVTYMEENPIRLDRGDALILFTDGIHEARNEKEEEYGMDRLAKIIPRVSENNASSIANAIIEDVMKFVGNAEQYDDMTLLVLKIK